MYDYDYEKAKKKLMVAKELLQEIENEIEYNMRYKKALKNNTLNYSDFPRETRFSVIKDNCKTVRRLLLEVSK